MKTTGSAKFGPLAWVALALCLAALFTLAPLIVPVIFAAWTATVSRPLLERLTRAMGGRNSAAAVIVVALVLVVAAIAAALVASVVSGSSELWALVSKSPSAQAALQAIVSPGTESSEAPPMPQTLAGLLPWLQEHSSDAFNLIGGVAGAAAKSVIGIVLFFFGTWTFLVDGPRAWTWALTHLPMQERPLRRLGAAFSETGRGLLIGVGLTNAAQALFATGCYLALGIPRAIVLGLLTGVAAFVPLGGAAIIWAPVTAGLYLTGHPGKAAVMLVCGAIISTMDNVLRPVFARYGKLDLPVYLLFLSVFGGLAAWGPFGAILGPLVLRLALEALSLVREEREAEGQLSRPAEALPRPAA